MIDWICLNCTIYKRFDLLYCLEMNYLRPFNWINIPELNVSLIVKGHEDKAFQKLGQIFMCSEIRVKDAEKEVTIIKVFTGK